MISCYTHGATEMQMENLWAMLLQRGHNHPSFYFGKRPAASFHNINGLANHEYHTLPNCHRLIIDQTKIKLLCSALGFCGFKRGLLVQTRSSKDRCSTDQTIILGLQIFLDYRSLSSIGQKILMMLPPPLHITPFFDLISSFEAVWMFSESYSSSFRFLIFLPFCIFVLVNL